MAIETYNLRDTNRVITKSYEGCVVAKFVQCNRVMSDIYADEYFAIAWNEAKGTWDTIQYSSCFELDPIRGSATVDATPEIMDRYLAKLENEKRLREEADTARREQIRLIQAKIAHNTPTIGKEMVVAKGRKVAKGTKGIVFWVRDGRVGLRTSDRKEGKNWADVVWVTASNLESTTPFEGSV